MYGKSLGHFWNINDFTQSNQSPSPPHTVGIIIVMSTSLPPYLPALLSTLYNFLTEKSPAVDTPLLHLYRPTRRHKHFRRRHLVGSLHAPPPSLVHPPVVSLL